MMKIQLTWIEMDTSIQCRAMIDTALVNEYAEQMVEGDSFPPVILFGSKEKFWIGDGWHRIMAARQIGAVDILAEAKPGGRIEALKYALSANTLHGFRRTNADKRRCVEIALREFPNLSSRAIAEMAGVGHQLVDSFRQMDESSTLRTGQDGKQYPASRRMKSEEQIQKEVNDENIRSELGRLGPPRNGMQFARLAIMQLEQIRDDDEEREQALQFVKEWIENNER